MMSFAGFALTNGSVAGARGCEVVGDLAYSQRDTVFCSQRAARTSTQPKIDIRNRSFLASPLSSIHFVKFAGRRRIDERNLQEDVIVALTVTHASKAPSSKPKGKDGSREYSKPRPRVGNVAIPSVEELLEAVEAPGVTLNICKDAIHSLVSSGRINLADQVRLHVLKKIPLTADFFESLMRLYVRRNILHKAQEIWGEFLGSGLTAHIGVYTAATLMFSKLGQRPQVLKLFEEARAAKFTPTVEMYNQLLSSAAKKGDVAEVLSIRNSMTDDGVQPNFHTLSTLVKLYVRAGDIAEIERLLEVIRQSDHQSAEADYDTKVSLLYTLAQLGRMDEVMSLVGEMKKEGIKLNFTAYAIVMDGWAKADRADMVEQLYQELVTSGARPNDHIMNIVMLAHAKQGNVEAVLRLINRLKELNRRPNQVTYNTVCYHLKKRGHVEEARALQQEMAASGLLPDTDSYNFKLDACWRKGDVEGCRSILQDMRRNKVPFSSRTYTLMVNTCVTKGAVGEVEEVWREASRSGIELDHTFFHSVMAAYAGAGDSARMERVMDEVREKGLILNAPAYNVMMKGYIKSGQYDLAIKLYEMQAEQGVATLVTYTSALKAAAHIGRKDLVNKVRDRVRESDVRPDIMYYNSLLSAFVRLGEAEEAERILRSMETEGGIVPDGICYTTLLDAYNKLDNVQAMLELHSEMQSKGILLPELAYILLIEALARNRLVAQAEQTLSDMTECGYPPSRHAYKCVLVMYNQLGASSERCRVLKQEMKRRGVGIDTATYNIYMRRAINAQRWDEVQRLAKEMKSLDMAYDEQTYSILMEFYSKHQPHLEKALSLKSDMILTGIKGNLHTWNSLLMLAGTSGPRRLAKSLFQEMQELGVMPDAVTFESLMRTFVDDSDLILAETILADTVWSGVRPPLTAYRILLEAQSEDRDTQGIERLLKQMKDRGIEIDRETVDAMIKDDTRWGSRVQNVLDSCGLKIKEKMES